jgi:hypothetical protein
MGPSMSEIENEGRRMIIGEDPRRAERHQRSTSVFFENGSDGNARSIMSA